MYPTLSQGTELGLELWPQVSSGKKLLVLEVWPWTEEEVTTEGVTPRSFLNLLSVLLNSGVVSSPC